MSSSKKKIESSSVNPLSKPLVTVIVPVFNGMPYLEETLKSIINQTLKNIEIITIDDGSTDGSLDLLNGMSDNRLIVVSQDNSGLCATLNRAILYSRGIFIARCDQDDVCHPRRLEKQLCALKYSGLDCVFSHINKIGDLRSWANHDKEFGEEGVIEFYTQSIHGCLVNSTLFAKKECLLEVGGYRAEFYPSDDYDLVLRLSEKYKLGIIKEKLVNYRFHNKANTFKYFFEMQAKSRWVEDCYKQRSLGLEEKKFEEYSKIESSSLIRCFIQRKKDYYKLFMRLGGNSFLCGGLSMSFVYVSLAFFIRPISFCQRFSKILWAFLPRKNH